TGDTSASPYIVATAQQMFLWLFIFLLTRPSKSQHKRAKAVVVKIRCDIQLLFLVSKSVEVFLVV
ncbi:hypothetical protein CPB84DRAFT_1787627, partial [Gymnopilus junonius]